MVRHGRIAIPPSEFATVKHIHGSIFALIASHARCVGSARPCSHSCRVRLETCNFIAASLCEKSCFFRQAKSRSASEPGSDLRLRLRTSCGRDRQLIVVSLVFYLEDGSSGLRIRGSRISFNALVGRKAELLQRRPRDIRESRICCKGLMVTSGTGLCN